ncbi:MAG TPA: BamA/TamA family outer membrane protein, partial [Flavipsychrobacter sp.]|nr:BamA/TamA family outer membrane protein [Flavipsychrobacter sp.]
YYGIGESTPDSLETQYESKRFIADVNVLKRIGNKLFLGPKLVYKNYYAIHSTQPYYDAQLQSGSAFRLGLTFLKDTRNNLLNPWNGTYFDLSSTYSIYDRNYLKLHADLRKYHTATSWLAAAGRLYSEFTFGTPHFYDYACIGGDKYVRGFYYGRLRDKHMSTLQLELRANVIWRLGIAAFGGVTKLYPSFDKFQINNMQANYGAGIRFLIDRKSNINLRFDYAIGSGEQDGFYVAFGESF